MEVQVEQGVVKSRKSESSEMETSKERLKPFRKEGKTYNMRVRSWLRMNAGGVPNTCKSNGVMWKDSSEDGNIT